MYKFSPSSLGLLKDCPRCFWLAFNKGVKRPSGIFPSLPSGMDKILKAHFDQFAKLGTLPPELKALEGTCKLFPDLQKLEEWRSNFTGIQYSTEQFLLRGAIDNLLVSDGKLVVLDYKTRGYPLKDSTADHYSDQLDLYNFFLRKNNHQTAAYSYLLFPCS